MKRTSLIGLLLLPFTFFLPASFGGDGLGTTYCFGNGCPCDNDDPNAGCANSTGVGTLATAIGSVSIAADDFQLIGTQMPTNSVSIVLASRTQQTFLFRDGLLCMGFPFTRLQVHRNSHQVGSVRFDHIVSKFEEQGLTLIPGDTFNFQIWHRDSGNDSPCGEKSNLSNGVTITFEP